MLLSVNFLHQPPQSVKSFTLWAFALWLQCRCELWYAHAASKTVAGLLLLWRGWLHDTAWSHSTSNANHRGYQFGDWFHRKEV